MSATKQLADYSGNIKMSNVNQLNQDTVLTWYHLPT